MYEPGELKVVAYDEKGNPAAQKVVKTAGKPARIACKADREHLKADGNDLAFVTVSLTDGEGTLIPYADDQLTFEVSGAGSFKAVCNGDATSLESFTQPTMKLFNGQLVVVIQTMKQKGDILLKVNDKKRRLSTTLSLTAE